YTGTLVLVSHDRSFLDAVVTQSLVADGDGRWVEIAGGYSDWLAWRDLRNAAGRGDVGDALTPAGTGPAQGQALAAAAKAVPAPGRGRKLSFKEARELADLPTRIQQLEGEQAGLAEQLQSDLGPDAARRSRDIAGRLEAITAEIDQCLERWTELEARVG
ncbi:MAG TPA: ABC transporter ATP-binding protein, partial [Gammaproteobacteria bacterium]|nr:ABC transporter ATP-binding protein [Gammaproteobacteria bacterium]